MTKVATAGTIDWIYNGLALVFFLAVVYSVYTRRPAGNTAVAVFAAVFCALLGNPDRFQTVKFSLTGVETSARQAIQQVQITLEQLQRLATTLGEASLNELAFSGAIFERLTTAGKFHIRDEIVARLHDIGVEEKDILQAQFVWRLVYCNALKDKIGETVKELLPQTDTSKEIAELPKEGKMEGLPSPGTLEKWTTSKGINDPRIAELLQEYKRVWTTGRMQKPERFDPAPQTRG